MMLSGKLKTSQLKSDYLTGRLLRQVKVTLKKALFRQKQKGESALTDTSTAVDKLCAVLM